MRQRKAIDKAFERGINVSSNRAGKRRKVDDGRAVDIVQNEGGFVDDRAGSEGGYHDVEGGFMVEDDEGGGGGFLVDGAEEVNTDEEITNGRKAEDGLASNSVERIPLSALPRLLAALSLPNDDDVLGVFRSSASGWDVEDAATRRRNREDEGELTVERKDFRAVCAALMGPDEMGDKAGSHESETTEEEDVYHLPAEDDESSLSSLSGSDYAGESSKPRTTSPRSRTKRSTKTLEAMTDRKQKQLSLTSRQKEVVREIWDMLKPKARDGGRQSNILGREDVKHWVRTLGEMWTEDEVRLDDVEYIADVEITDMVGLFSTQHEGRGLDFSDFATTMLRAGLV